MGTAITFPTNLQTVATPSKGESVSASKATDSLDTLKARDEYIVETMVGSESWMTFITNSEIDALF